MLETPGNISHNESCFYQIQRWLCYVKILRGGEGELNKKKKKVRKMTSISKIKKFKKAIIFNSSHRLQ